MLNESELLDIPASNLISFSEIFPLLANASSLYLFTMGSVEILRLISYAIDNNIRVLYRDCYFPSKYQHLRLIDPLSHLFSPYRSSFCPSRIVLKQAIRQLLTDPFRTTMYFSGDSHCWPTNELYDKLEYFELSPLALTTLFDCPSRSLLFTLNSTQNNIPIDWDYFYSSGYSLFYKPHPVPCSDYAFYPDYVKPMAANFDPSQIHFDDTSFLVSFYSFSLASTNQSISLANLYFNLIHPLQRLYRDNAVFVPSTIDDLNSILAIN